MQSIGEDPPTEDDIEIFGLYYSCQKTLGNFAIVKDGEFAAKGRIGTSPLYWKRGTQEFSFEPLDGYVDFPDGHLYNMKQDRLVCWDPVYYDKPLPTSQSAVKDIKYLIQKIVQRHECDGFVMSAGCGSRIINDYISTDVPAFTIGYTHGYSIDVEEVERDNRRVIYFDETCEFPRGLDHDEIPMYILARNLKQTTSHRKFICGLGCTELFNDSTEYTPYVKHIVDNFAKFGLELWSPFFDNELIEYVLDKTHPEDRPDIMKNLFTDYDDIAGLDISETVGDEWSFVDVDDRPKKKWWFYW